MIEPDVADNLGEVGAGGGGTVWSYSYGQRKREPPKGFLRNDLLRLNVPLCNFPESLNRDSPTRAFLPGYCFFECDCVLKLDHTVRVCVDFMRITLITVF